MTSVAMTPLRRKSSISNSTSTAPKQDRQCFSTIGPLNIFCIFYISSRQMQVVEGLSINYYYIKF